jgi:hypothetical protein
MDHHLSSIWHTALMKVHGEQFLLPENLIFLIFWIIKIIATNWYVSEQLLSNEGFNYSYLQTFQMLSCKKRGLHDIPTALVSRKGFLLKCKKPCLMMLLIILSDLSVTICIVQLETGGVLGFRKMHCFLWSSKWEKFKNSCYVTYWNSLYICVLCDSASRSLLLKKICNGAARKI